VFLYAPIKQVAEVPRVVGANMTGEDEHPWVGVNERGKMMSQFLRLSDRRCCLAEFATYHVSDIERQRKQSYVISPARFLNCFQIG
jgi:hypothetical protein